MAITHKIYHREAGTLGGEAIVIECHPAGVPLFFEATDRLHAAAFVMRLENGRIDTSGLLVRAV